MKKTALKKKSKNPVIKLKYKLVEISHTHVRKRDSVSDEKIGGYCFDCKYYIEGQQFQAGHWIPDSKGVITRYHPHNMHGQAGKCNCAYQQEFVKINYTFAMQKKYGIKYCKKLKEMSEKTIRVNVLFYTKMIELYEIGDEQEIIKYLESLII